MNNVTDELGFKILYDVNGVLGNEMIPKVRNKLYMKLNNKINDGFEEIFFNIVPKIEEQSPVSDITHKIFFSVLYDGSLTLGNMASPALDDELYMKLSRK